MPKALIIRNISLDTSFIESQNFLAGSALSDLKDLSRKGFASLFITDIVYREVLARFKKRIIEEEERSKTIHKSIESHLRVLKNFPDYIPYFSLPKMDTDLLIKDFKIKFDQWIKDAKVKTITTGHITIEEIFDDYFEARAPFGKSNKKSEFPDAFSFLALKKYFIERKKKCYFVTSDKDFDEMPADTIIPIKEVREEIDKILRAEEDKKSDIIKLIATAYSESKTKLENDARLMILDFIEEEVTTRSELGDMEIDILDRIDLSDVEFTEYSIVYIGQSGARIECKANFAYELNIAVEDKTQAWYDKEDDKWHFVEHTSVVVKDSQDVIFSVVIDLDPETDYYDAEIEDFNNGKGFNIFEKWDRDDHYYYN